MFFPFVPLYSAGLRAPTRTHPARSRSLALRLRLPCVAGPEPAADGKERPEGASGGAGWGIHPLKACHSHYVHPFLSSRYFVFIRVVFFPPPPSNVAPVQRCRCAPGCGAVPVAGLCRLRGSALRGSGSGCGRSSGPGVAGLDGMLATIRFVATAPQRCAEAGPGFGFHSPAPPPPSPPPPAPRPSYAARWAQRQDEPLRVAPRCYFQHPFRRRKNLAHPGLGSGVGGGGGEGNLK